MSTMHSLVALANTCATASATTLPSARTLVYTAPKPKGPVLDTPSDKRLQAPPTSGLFARLKFQAKRYAALCPMVLGVGAHTRKDCGMACPMCLSPLPPAGLDSLRVVPKSRQGAAMTNPQGQTTPTQATSATPTQAHQLFADACNCAAMARWYTQRGNIAAATRKARQHLAALRQLAKLEGGTA